MNNDTKSPAMQSFLDNLSLSMFGRARSLAQAGNGCVMCGKPAVKFDDKASEREYQISGLCQPCQNKVFGDL